MKGLLLKRVLFDLECVNNFPTPNSRFRKEAFALTPKNEPIRWDLYKRLNI